MFKEETFAFLSQLTKGQYTFFFTSPKSSEKVRTGFIDLKINAKFSQVLSKFSSDVAIQALDRIMESGSWQIDSLKACLFIDSFYW